MAELKLKGNCYLCGKTFSKATFKRHVLANHMSTEADGQACALVKVESMEDKNYWLFLDIPLTSSLKTLDSFFRKIWLECCGHMSAFYDRDYSEVGMTAKIGSFPVETALLYEYDFGDTTPLKLTIEAHENRPLQRSAVRLLGRNEPYPFTCAECGAPADFICCECMWDDTNPFFCETCAQAHDHDSFLPVTNSPRMGVCGYCGELDDFTFSAKKVKTAVV